MGDSDRILFSGSLGFLIIFKQFPLKKLHLLIDLRLVILTRFSVLIMSLFNRN